MTVGKAWPGHGADNAVPEDIDYGWGKANWSSYYR
jgi:hypothetical protein